MKLRSGSIIFLLVAVIVAFNSCSSRNVDQESEVLEYMKAENPDFFEKLDDIIDALIKAEYLDTWSKDEVGLMFQKISTAQIKTNPIKAHSIYFDNGLSTINPYWMMAFIDKIDHSEAELNQNTSFYKVGILLSDRMWGKSDQTHFYEDLPAAISSSDYEMELYKATILYALWDLEHQIEAAE